MTVLTADALLFDLDGTLVDSSSNVEQMWRAWCEKTGVDSAKLLATSEGRQGKSVVAEFAPHLDPVEEDRWIIDYQLQQSGPVAEVSGASAMLDDLGDDTTYRWGIVTSCVAALAYKRLDGAGLRHPPMLVPADDIEESKPSPEGFLLGAKRLEVLPSRCLVFEDSEAGLSAAAAAEMTGVAITAATRDTPETPYVARDWTQIEIVARDGQWHVTLTS